MQENDKDDDDDKVDQSDKNSNAIMTQRKKWKLLEVHEIVFQRPSQPRLNLKATNVWGKKRELVTIFIDVIKVCELCRRLVKKPAGHHETLTIGHLVEGLANTCDVSLVPFF